MKQLFEVVSYLHTQGIVHRDLKPENILFVQKNLLDLKIIGNNYNFLRNTSLDFGLAKELQPGEVISKQEFVGTPAYMAPEIIRQIGYSFPADLWSLGVIMYTLIFGIAPFEDTIELRLLLTIQHAEWKFPEETGYVTQEAMDLIRRLLTRDPQARITAKEALSHVWFNMNL
jgi:serine/threonine protein kinase